LGVIPPDTKLTARPPEIPAWDSLSADEQRVAERLMEIFAAYTAQTDYEVGRVLDALEEIGQLHNTLIFWRLVTMAPPWKNSERMLQRNRYA
jgi:arylsulfatase A-like enzyme